MQDDRDIKITLSTNERKRAPGIEAEVEWLEELGELYYPLGANRPRSCNPGAWLYLIRGGALVARGRIEEIVEPGEARVSYGGQPDNAGNWEARIERLEIAQCAVPHTGFRSFRYVTPEEQATFEAAFK